MINDNSILKVLCEDGYSCWGTNYKWPLPCGNVPGNWVEVEGELKETENGFHLLFGLKELPFWIGPAIFFVEYEGEIKHEKTNTPIVRKARLLSRVQHWDEYTLRNFAEDCYKHAKLKFINNDQHRKQSIEILEDIWKNKMYKHVPRQAVEVLGGSDVEQEWQVNRLLLYLRG